MHNASRSAWSKDLWAAVTDGAIDRVRACLDAEADLNVINPHNSDTYVSHAIEKGHDDIAVLLIDRGADVNLGENRGRAPLVTAVWRRRVTVIDALLARGANPNPHVYIDGDTILNFAYSSRPYETRTAEQEKVDREITKKLLKAGSNPNALDSSGWTFVMKCPGDLEMLRLAFECGAEINRASKDGTPILYWMYNYPSSLELAIERGADIEARDRYNFTHLMVACNYGRLEAVRVFLKHGANISATAPALYGKKGTVDAFSLARDKRGDGSDQEEIFQLICKRKPSFFGRLFAK